MGAGGQTGTVGWPRVVSDREMEILVGDTTNLLGVTLDKQQSHQGSVCRGQLSIWAIRRCLGHTYIELVGAFEQNEHTRLD